MTLLDAFSIRSRLWGAFSLLLFLMSLIIVVGIRGGLKTEAELSALVSQEMRKYELVSDFNAATRLNARYTMQLFVVNQQ